MSESGVTSTFLIRTCQEQCVAQARIRDHEQRAKNGVEIGYSPHQLSVVISDYTSHTGIVKAAGVQTEP